MDEQASVVPVRVARDLADALRELHEAMGAAAPSRWRDGDKGERAASAAWDRAGEVLASDAALAVFDAAVEGEGDA